MDDGAATSTQGRPLSRQLTPLTRPKAMPTGDILTNIENITGSRQADVITGDAVPNVIKGCANNDILSGAAGGNDIAEW